MRAVAQPPVLGPMTTGLQRLEGKGIQEPVDAAEIRWDAARRTPNMAVRDREPPVQVPGADQFRLQNPGLLKVVWSPSGTAGSDSKWFCYEVATTAQFPAAAMCLRAHAGGSVIQPKRVL
jgi:hypothetical protein